MKKDIPRVMIAAMKSGSGKTLITCALLSALKKRNIDVVSVKCGPDYIDPMFHRQILNIESENLDTFFTEEDKTRDLLGDFASSHEFVLMEGVMGLYDGLGGVLEAGSSYNLAKVTNTPIILVVDAHGMAYSMIPQIKGMLDYDKAGLIKGIILNRISEKFYKNIKPVFEKEIDVPLVGIYENHKDTALESRYLGLKLPGLIDEIQGKLTKASDYLEETVNINEIINIARSATALEYLEATTDYSDDKGLTLAVARDDAFCFYYDANLREFRKRGIRVVEFSPLADERVPEADGILLGGGYPENYAERLSNNQSMLSSIKNAINEGMPTLAECGGFMYLHRYIEDEAHNEYEMVNAIDAKVTYTGKSVRFGYLELMSDGPGFMSNDSLVKGHEFHYYDSTSNGEDCVVTKPYDRSKRLSSHYGSNHLWGFPHLYYPSCPDFVDNFINEMARYHDNK